MNPLFMQMTPTVGALPAAHDEAIELDAATRFLALLDESGEAFTFQTFDDSPAKRGALASVLHGSLAEHWGALAALNARGGGVFVTINETDLRGRKAGNVTRVRALFADTDGAALEPILACGLEPHAVVESSPGKWHAYWLVDGLPLTEFSNLQKAIAAKFGTDPTVHDLPRVLRLPGFDHRKGEPFRVHVVYESGALPYGPDAVRAAFTTTPARAAAPATNTGARSPAAAIAVVSPEVIGDLRSALSHLPADDRDLWIRVGCALHELGDAGRNLWEAWSKTSPKWRTTDVQTWAGLHSDRTGYAAVFKAAQDAGWVNPAAGAAARVPGTSTRRPWGDAHDACAHLANANRLRHHFGDSLLYVKGVGWHQWRTPWRVDDLGVQHVAAKLGRLIAEEAAGMAPWVAKAGDPDERAKRQKAMDTRFYWAGTSEHRSTISATLELARGLFAVEPDAMDADPWLLSCPNGIVDLRTGTLRPHRPEDRTTKMAGIAFDPPASAPTWLRFLDRTFQGDVELIAFMQMLAGYWSTGRTDPHKLVVAHGGGGNGKGVFFGALQRALGQYAMSAPHGLLIARRGDKPEGSIADLRGARLVVAAESGEGGALNEDLVKLLTGGDRLRARHLYQNSFEFTPSHKLILHTNHKPLIRGTDEGIRRRLWLVPFLATIPEAERDPQLAEKLEAELPGILAWVVEGARRYADAGCRIAAPAIVEGASRQYLTEQDVLGTFIGDCCEVDPRGMVQAKALRVAYAAWCDEAGERPMGDRLLGMRLSERGVERQKRRDGWWYAGIALRLAPAKTSWAQVA